MKISPAGGLGKSLFSRGLSKEAWLVASGWSWGVRLRFIAGWSFLASSSNKFMLFLFLFFFSNGKAFVKSLGSLSWMSSSCGASNCEQVGLDSLARASETLLDLLGGVWSGGMKSYLLKPYGYCGDGAADCECETCFDYLVWAMLITKVFVLQLCGYQSVRMVWPKMNNSLVMSVGITDVFMFPGY